MAAMTKKPALYNVVISMISLFVHTNWTKVIWHLHTPLLSSRALQIPAVLSRQSLDRLSSEYGSPRTRHQEQELNNCGRAPSPQLNIVAYATRPSKDGRVPPNLLCTPTPSIFSIFNHTLTTGAAVGVSHRGEGQSSVKA
jgi:hypothetical protein